MLAVAGLRRDRLAPTQRLRLVPFHADDFARAGVLEPQWRIIRREGEPETLVARHLERLQARHLLEFSIAYAHAHDGQHRPRPGVEIKDHQALGISRHSNKVPPSGDQRGLNGPSEGGSVEI